MTSRFKNFYVFRSKFAPIKRSKTIAGSCHGRWQIYLSLDAVNHALSGATVTLAHENLEDFRYAVQAIAETEWRLRRIPILESTGHTRADDGPWQHIPPKVSSLGLHERRLQRNLEKKTAEFENSAANAKLPNHPP